MRRWRPRTSNSYMTTCKWCGELIHMREMPHGQWVAFGGSELVHQCPDATEYISMPGRNAKSHTTKRDSTTGYRPEFWESRAAQLRSRSATGTNSEERDCNTGYRPEFWGATSPATPLPHTGLPSPKQPPAGQELPPLGQPASDGIPSWIGWLIALLLLGLLFLATR